MQSSDPCEAVPWLLLFLTLGSCTAWAAQGVVDQQLVLWLVMSWSLPPQSSHRGCLQLHWVKNYLDFHLGVVMPLQALAELKTP